MSDPSIDAAQRAWTAEGWGDGPLSMSEGHLAEAAARERAKSVQELHKPVTRTDYTDERWVECTSCCGDWPCETAKRVYPSSELGLT